MITKIKRCTQCSECDGLRSGRKSLLIVMLRVQQSSNNKRTTIPVGFECHCPSTTQGSCSRPSWPWSSCSRPALGRTCTGSRPPPPPAQRWQSRADRIPGFPRASQESAKPRLSSRPCRTTWRWRGTCFWSPDGRRCHLIEIEGREKCKGKGGCQRWEGPGPPRKCAEPRLKVIDINRKNKIFWQKYLLREW